MKMAHGEDEKNKVKPTSAGQTCQSSRGATISSVQVTTWGVVSVDCYPGNSR